MKLKDNRESFLLLGEFLSHLFGQALTRMCDDLLSSDFAFLF